MYLATSPFPIQLFHWFFSDFIHANEWILNSIWKAYTRTIELDGRRNYFSYVSRLQSIIISSVSNSDERFGRHKSTLRLDFRAVSLNYKRARGEKIFKIIFLAQRIPVITKLFFCHPRFSHSFSYDFPSFHHFNSSIYFLFMHLMFAIFSCTVHTRK